MLFVICSEKGGVGKSVLAQNLCAFLLKEFDEVLLVDCDPQKTSLDWASERAKTDLPRILCTTIDGSTHHGFLDAAKRYQHVVIDFGGADSVAMRNALSVANVAIVPFRPKRRDLKTAPHMASVMQQTKATNHKLKVFSIINQAPTLPSQAGRTNTAKEYLASLGLNPLQHHLRQLNSFDDCDESGQSVFDYKKDNKAALDVSAAMDELIKVVINEQECA